MKTYLTAKHRQVFEQSRRAVFPGIFSIMEMATTYKLRARYLFPIDRLPIRDGVISVSNGRIVSLDHESDGDCLDLGDVAILPAFINAHTHLEFSNLEQPLGKPGMAFTEWIREVVRWRRTLIAQSEGSDWRHNAIRNGIEESRRGGVLSLGEIATLPNADLDGRYEAMQGVNFLELLGLADERHDDLLAAANAHITTFSSNSPHLSSGLSPHAPYTVSPKLVDSITTLAARTHTPVAMHLAETREELELLQSGCGPFRELLTELGAWHPGVIPKGSTPLDYLNLLARADRSLVIHGNYLAREEIEFAAQQRDRMSVIYCPRTHAYFGHERYPLQEMLKCGVNVALGTDSRASNPDLNMLNELRFVARQHQDIAPETILQLATINAATALGIGESHGTLAFGKLADLVIVPISATGSSDPHALLFGAAQNVKAVYRSTN